MKKELSRRSGVQIAAELMKLLGGRLSAVMLLAVLNGSLGFLCAMGVPFFGAVGIAKALGESIPLSYGAIAGLCVGCGVLRGGAVSGAVRQPLYRLPAAGGASGQNLYQAPGPLPRQAGKPPEGQPSHHDHGGHRNAGGILCPHRFPRLHRRACVIGGDGGHRPCCKLVSVPDRCGGLSVHRRSAAPVFLPPHGRDRYAVQAGAWGLRRVFSRQHQGHTGAGSLQRRRDPMPDEQAQGGMSY